MNAYLSEQGKPPVTPKDFHKFFAKYDTNGDGVITKNEMA